MGMRWVAGIVGVVLVAFAPGMVLLRVVAAGWCRDTIAWIAAAPPVSLAAIFATSQVLDLFGAPVRPAMQIGAIFAVSLALRALIAVRRARRQRVDRAPADPVTLELVPALVLVAAVVIGLGVWGAALSGQPPYPPSRDGEYHGYFARRIADAESVHPARVVVTDPVTEDAAAAYYPLALHTSVALQFRVAGTPIGVGLICWIVIASALVLPLGLFVLVRRLLPSRRWVPPLVALAAPFMAMFPYRPAAWSAISLIVGLSMVPVTLALILEAVREPLRPRTVSVAAVAAFGVISTHTSQVGLIGLWSAVLIGSELIAQRHDRSAGAAILGRAVAVAGGIALVLLPSTLLFGAAASERSDFFEQPWMSLPMAVGEIVTLSHAMVEPQRLIAVVAIAGVVISIRDRVLGPWLWCTAGAVLLFLAAAASDGMVSWLRPLTRVWYYGPWRLSYNVALAAIVFTGLAMARVVDAAERLGARHSPRHRRAASIVVIVLLIVAGSATSIGQSVDLVRHAYRSNTPARAGQLEAFDFLASEVGPDEAVLNEERDGSAWMYVDRGLRPLLVVYSLLTSPTAAERIYLLEHIADYATDPTVRDLVERWNVAYVLVNDVGFVDEPPRLTAEQLVGEVGLTEVFRSGGARVFRIDR